ncbi:CopG family transcriptional regulator [Candidatus Woesearchaeota archaeon]|nr:CopG family transcriptional regulator [Candidatus Woesearchaeota archaeon]
MKIEIPNKITEKLQKRVDSSDEFKNVQEYVEYILKQVVERLENENDEEDEKEEVYSEEDEEKVKERLRGLGYLD